MAVSGIIGGSYTVAQMVQKAMREIGVLAAGETPEAADLEDGMDTLNWMLKSMAADGANLFRIVEGSLAFPINTATVALSPYCSDVLEARLVQSSTFERPLQRWEVGQYASLPNKAQPGWPTAFYLSRTIDTLSMTLWPVPSEAMVVNFTYARIPDDVTDGAETIDLPQQWVECAYFNLASRLANTFGATRTDPNSVARVDAMAQRLYAKMLDSDRPASLFLSNYNSREVW